MGQTVLQTWESLRKHGTVKGGMVVSAVTPFPEIDLPNITNKWIFAWQAVLYGIAAVDAGKAAITQINTILASCPGTKFVLVGYSVGALAAHVTLQDLSQQGFDMTKIAAVVFFGDPIYPLVKATAPREGIGRAIGLWANGAPYVPAGLEKRTLSMCVSYDLKPPTVPKERTAYDPVCLVKPPVKLDIKKDDVNLQSCMDKKIQESASLLCPHFQYARLGATQIAANWLANILHVH